MFAEPSTAQRVRLFLVASVTRCMLATEASNEYVLRISTDRCAFENGKPN